MFCSLNSLSACNIIRKKQSFTSVMGKGPWFQHANKMLPKQKITDAPATVLMMEAERELLGQQEPFLALHADVSVCCSEPLTVGKMMQMKEQECKTLRRNAHSRYLCFLCGLEVRT